MYPIYEDEGFPPIPWDPEPRPRDPDSPTDDELDEHGLWMQRHWEEIEPWMRAEAGPEPPDVTRRQGFLERFRGFLARLPGHSGISNP
jgi:hypothetical protein